MTVHLTVGPDMLALGLITQRLRPADREECYAMSWSDDPQDLAEKTFHAGEFQWVAWKGHDPIANIGAAAMWPNVWACWAFGTDRWPEVVLTLTKHVKRVMIPALFLAGAQRVQCYASENHDQSHRWLTSMGAQCSDPLEKWGKDGQTFYCYWWDRRTVEQRSDLSRHLPADGIAPTSDGTGHVRIRQTQS